MVKKYDALLRGLVTLPEQEIWVNAHDMVAACYKGGWTEMGEMVEYFIEGVHINPRRARPARITKWKDPIVGDKTDD